MQTIEQIARTGFPFFAYAQSRGLDYCAVLLAADAVSGRWLSGAEIDRVAPIEDHNAKEIAELVRAVGQTSRDVH